MTDMRSKSTFTRHIAFPSHPYEAAFIFFAAMAYPEEGSGNGGGAGSNFATALAKYSMWTASKTRGLAFMREQRADREYVAPQKREFLGLVERGRRRIDRRFVAYDLLGMRFLQGFSTVQKLGAKAISEGRPEDAYHMDPNGGPSPARAELWARALPSPKQVMARALGHWVKRFSLNTYGPVGTPAQRVQRVKDLDNRAFIPSIPVLHMVHAFNQCARECGPKIDGWDERDPVFAMLLNADVWIWRALEVAEEWRVNADSLPGNFHLTPENMIRITKIDK